VAISGTTDHQARRYDDRLDLATRGISNPVRNGISGRNSRPQPRRSCALKRFCRRGLPFPGRRPFQPRTRIDRQPDFAVRDARHDGRRVVVTVRHCLEQGGSLPAPTPPASGTASFTGPAPDRDIGL
jgi:hypothetical protein